VEYSRHFITEFTTFYAFALATRMTLHHTAVIFVRPIGPDHATVYVFGIFLPVLWRKKWQAFLCTLTAFSNGLSTIEAAWGEDKGNSSVSHFMSM
jgi:hypothetical protein